MRRLVIKVVGRASGVALSDDRGAEAAEATTAAGCRGVVLPITAAGRVESRPRQLGRAGTTDVVKQAAGQSGSWGGVGWRQ